jgi:hypothetical protein
MEALEKLQQESIAIEGRRLARFSNFAFDDLV